MERQAGKRQVPWSINFAAIHTSSNVRTAPSAFTSILSNATFTVILVLFQTITHALTRLAEQPELLGPLRDEIEKSIVADGWTSAALANMWKLDSLLRETLRFHGISLRKTPSPLPLSPCPLFSSSPASPGG